MTRFVTTASSQPHPDPAEAPPGRSRLGSVLSMRVLRGIASGEISLVFRRWPMPLASDGTQLHTAVGVIGIDKVTPVDPHRISDAEAHRAGFRSAAGLRSSLRAHRGSVYRLEVSYLGPAPQPSEPEWVELSAKQRAEIDRKLAQLDVSAPRGPWTRQLLRLLRERPGVSAADLAAEQGRPVSRCKSDVWKLRELGLVERTGSGFRLSAVAESFLDSPR